MSWRGSKSKIFSTSSAAPGAGRRGRGRVRERGLEPRRGRQPDPRGDAVQREAGGNRLEEGVLGRLDRGGDAVRHRGAARDHDLVLPAVPEAGPGLVARRELGAGQMDGIRSATLVRAAARALQQRNLPGPPARSGLDRPGRPIRRQRDVRPSGRRQMKFRYLRNQFPVRSPGEDAAWPESREPCADRRRRLTSISARSRPRRSIVMRPARKSFAPGCGRGAASAVGPSAERAPPPATAAASRRSLPSSHVLTAGCGTAAGGVLADRRHPPGSRISPACRNRRIPPRSTRVSL